MPNSKKIPLNDISKELPAKVTKSNKDTAKAVIKALDLAKIETDKKLKELYDLCINRECDVK